MGVVVNDIFQKFFYAVNVFPANRFATSIRFNSTINVRLEREREGDVSFHSLARIVPFNKVHEEDALKRPSRDPSIGATIERLRLPLSNASPSLAPCSSCDNTDQPGMQS